MREVVARLHKGVACMIVLAYFGATVISLSAGFGFAIVVTSFINSSDMLFKVVAGGTLGIVTIAAFLVLWRLFLRGKAFS
jgi:hypothetical protein